MTLAALRSDATVGQTLTLAGPKAWTVPEVIELCEKLADERAQVTQVSCWMTRFQAALLVPAVPVCAARSCTGMVAITKLTGGSYQLTRMLQGLHSFLQHSTGLSCLQPMMSM